MEILEFRKIKLTDRVEEKYGAWSRIYEYPLVFDIITEYNKIDNPLLHNTSWGFEGCHVTFKEGLDTKYPNSLHSDIKASKLPNTEIWDITKNPKDEYIDYFDIVINVSTVEEVNYDHIIIFNNLFKQVKKGGILILTFDLPGLQLDKFENMLGKKIERFDNEINGATSISPNLTHKGLTCGLLVIRKK